MPIWDGPYLLGQFNRMAGRPASDQVTDDTKYLWLSEAQDQVVADVASRYPEALYPTGVLPMLTTNNKIFTFGKRADGTDIFPIGKVMIFTKPSANPGMPLQPGWDYLERGTAIEIPNDRTYPAPLYWRGITPPLYITATTLPSILPLPARNLITLLAVKNFGQAGNINPDLAAQMTELWSRDFPRWMLVWKTQFVGGGALGPLVWNPVYGPY